MFARTKLSITFEFSYADGSGGGNTVEGLVTRKDFADVFPSFVEMYHQFQGSSCELRVNGKLKFV